MGLGLGVRTVHPGVGGCTSPAPHRLVVARDGGGRLRGPVLLLTMFGRSGECMGEMAFIARHWRPPGPLDPAEAPVRSPTGP